MRPVHQREAGPFAHGRPVLLCPSHQRVGLEKFVVEVQK